MRIVVCGAQKPFMRGGAEQLQDALAGALRSSGHDADVVRVPVAWEKGRLLDSPLAWRLLPVDADMVIATNFPSYFVRHPNKIVWLLHQHRAAYDAVEAPWSDFGPDEDAWETQRILAEWDNRALSESRKVFTISGVVSERLHKYNGLDSQPLLHPAPLTDRLRPGPYGDYVLAVGRLAENKRTDLTIRAMAYTQPGIRLVVAGTGPMADDLTTLVNDLGLQDRVDFAGWVDEDELVKLLQNALAVTYLPLDEDYGYATLQAFAAAKPVVTAQDAGAVLDFVIDEQTGLVTDGSPEQIAQAIDKLAADHYEAERLGTAGRLSVANLSWDHVIDQILMP